MAASDLEETHFVSIKTTLPVQPMPSNASRQVITTERLRIRPFQTDDLEALHALRTQPEVMRFTSVGRVDLDRAETQTKLNPFLPPKDVLTHNCAICLKDTGEMVGIGGVHMYRGSLGWPEVGYMFRKEHWGGGLATEFLMAYLQAWSELPRADVEIKVDPRTIKAEHASEEQLLAVTEASNMRSQRVLAKCGFQHSFNCVTKDSQEGKEDDVVELQNYSFSPRRHGRN